MRPTDLPASSAIAHKHPHGTRIKYVGGCRCVPCRAANSRYESSRQLARRNGDWNGLVPADHCRNHLKKLSRKGVGYKSVAVAADIGKTVLAEILFHGRKFVRARTERKICSVTVSAVADNALIPAAPTWDRINMLLRAGFTKAELARRLNYRRPAIQFKRNFITARNASSVERLYSIIRNKGVDLIERGVSR